MNGKLLLHRLALHLLPRQFLGLVVHVLEIVLEFGIGDDPARQFCVQVLLICRTRAETLLPNEFLKRDIVIVRIVSEEFAGLWIASLELVRSHNLGVRCIAQSQTP